MERSNKIVLVGLVLLLALLTWLEANEREPLNWSPSFAAKDKIPLGSFVLYENLEAEDIQVRNVNVPPFEFLKDQPEKGTYFFLNDRLYFDDDELNKLFAWVEKGNTVFLAAENFSSNLLDSLDLRIGTAIPETGFSSKPKVNLANPELKNSEDYLYNRESYNKIFTQIDTAQHSVLGVTRLSSDTSETEKADVNFIKIPFGEGQILINTMPVAFSNYFMLYKDNAEYAARALGYLPVGNILFWDQYYKSGKAFYTSPLYIMLNNRALKWAYYFIIFGALIFVIFEGKRKQRSIPVITPLKNQSVYFTRTIAGLYLERKDHSAIANKKIALFLDYIRTELKIPTGERNEEFFRRVAAQTKKETSEVKKLFSFIDNIVKRENITEDELLKISTAIHSFKTK